MAGEQHLPKIAYGYLRIELFPGCGLLDFRGMKNIDDGLRVDLDDFGAAGNIEVVDHVSEKIAIDHDAGLRKHTEREGHAALARIGARLHADFHDAFAHGRVIAKARDVSYSISHGVLLKFRQCADRKQIPRFARDDNLPEREELRDAVTRPSPTRPGNRNRFGGWRNGWHRIRCERFRDKSVRR